MTLALADVAEEPAGTAWPGVAVRPRLAGAVQTHRGLVRGHNEDAFVFDLERGRFAVIDGMGGQNAGEVAAGVVRDWLEREEDLPTAIFRANREIVTRAADNAHERGMGCVVTAVQVAGRRLRLAHVGDTRAYLARPSGCRLLTRDHTTAHDRQQQLALSDRVARGLPGRHQVTRDVGGAQRRDSSWVVTGDEPFEPDDLLLLCSDGLHDLVSSDELYALLRQAREQHEPPPQLVRRLVQLALSRGGKDNVTVLAVRCEAGPAGGRLLERCARVLGDARVRAALLAAAFVTLPFAGAFGWSVYRETLPAPAAMVGLQRAALDPARRYDGDAALDGRLTPGVFVPLGTLYAAPGERSTRIASPGVTAPGAVRLKGLDLRFPADGQHRWNIRVEPGAVLEIVQASIRAPNLELAVELEGPDSRVRVIDSHLEIGRLSVSGGAGGDVTLDGGYVRLVDADAVLATNPVALVLDVPFDSAGAQRGEPAEGTL